MDCATYRGFLDCEQSELQAMTEDQSRNYLHLMMVEQRSGLEFPGNDFQKEVESDFGFSLIKARLEAVNIYDRVSKPLLLFITLLCDTPAELVLWAYTLTKIAEENPNGQIDFLLFSQYFPFGIPTKDGFSRLWDAQKGDGPHGNWLDRMEWLSGSG